MGFVILITNLLQGEKISADKFCFILGINIKSRPETVTYI